MYSNLEKEKRIGPLTLKNSLVMPAMGVFIAAPGGGVNDDIIAFYEARARGGVGLIITEVTRIDEGPGIGQPCQLAARSLSDIPSLQRLADTLHKYDCRVFLQLQHPGREASALICGAQPVAPSAVANPGGGEMPRELSTEECEQLVQRFVTGARIAQMAGLDGVELHAAHGYLINEFLSPAMNLRTDRYGGSFENRLRFFTEIIAGIRQACGTFPLSVRINAEEALPGGIDLRMAGDIAAALETSGVDVLNVSCYSAGCIEPGTYPEGYKRPLTQAIKDRVTVPVIGVSNIKEPRTAEALLRDGVCDLVGVGRAHLADPDWCNKAFAGRESEIRKCIGCLACFGEIAKCHRLKCAVNPVTCREREYAQPARDGNGHTIAIIGGGPAGIEAALVLRARGFAPVILEAGGRLGGTLNVADKGYAKDKITRYAQSLAAQVETSGIDVRLNTQATVAMVQAMNPVGVFIACGAEPVIPPLPGVEGAHVITAEDVLIGRASPSGSIAVIGSGMTGLETAEVLLGAGNEITLVEMQPQVGPGMYPAVVQDVMGRITQAGAQVLTGHRLERVEAPGVALTRLADGQAISIPADWVVLALGVRPRRETVARFKQAFPDARVIGDAVRGARILEAAQDAHGQAFVFSSPKMAKA